MKTKEEIEKIKLAFGGCEKCYGKGYFTVKFQEIGADDFGGEGYTKEKMEARLCSCDRGEQLKKYFKII